MEEKMFLQQLTQKNQIQSILKVNERTQQFGLSLTQEDAKLLVQERSDCLKNEQRVEFGGGILEKLIDYFCDSAYIYQDNYVESIGKLQEIFYFYKNESMDQLTDDELLTYMKESFEGECQGDLEYLEGTIMEKFARAVRKGPRLTIKRGAKMKQS